MKSFMTWVGGIVATVIGGLLIYYFTRPTPPPPEFAFEGMVIDGERSVPIKDALVSFEVEGAKPADAYHDLTDDNGSYGIKLSGLSESSKVTLRVHASGYRDESKHFTALINDNRYDPILKAMPTPTPPPGPHATPAPTPPAPLNLGHLKYVQKMSIPTFKVALEKK